MFDIGLTVDVRSRVDVRRLVCVSECTHRSDELQRARNTAVKALALPSGERAFA